MTFPEVWFTPDHARALGISEDGLPVNLADPKACARWFVDARFAPESHEQRSNVPAETLLPSFPGEPPMVWLGRLIAAAQAGTLKLPELEPEPERFKAGGLEWERLGRSPRKGEWMRGCADHPELAKFDYTGVGYEAIRPILPPPRVELQVGWKLVVKAGALRGSGWGSAVTAHIVAVNEHTVVFASSIAGATIARSTIDAAVAAGTLEVQHDPR